MYKEPIVIVSPVSKSRESQPEGLFELLSKCLYYWPYFLASLIISCGAALFYIKRIDPVYEIKAKLIIKDQKNASAEKTPLEKLNVYDQPKTVENEVEILKSRELIKNVVDELALWVQYYRKEDFSKKELYDQLPFKFKLQSGDFKSLQQSKFEISILDENSFSCQKLNGQPVKASFGAIIKSGSVSWTLNKSDKIKDYIGKTFEINFSDYDKTIDGYQRSIDVSLVSKLSPVVELTMEDHLPARGKDILDGLIKVYSQAALNEKNKVTLSTLTFIDNRLSSLSGELTSVEKSVEGFKSSRGMTDISAKAQVFLENVQSNDFRLNDVNVQLDILKGIEQYISSPSNSGNPPATLGISDPGLLKLVDELSSLQLQRSRLAAITPEQSPVFEPVNRQIKMIKEALKDNVQAIKVSLLATRKNLQVNNSRFENAIRNIPSQERQFLNIKRQQEIKENLYVYLLQKKEEIALSYAATLNDAKVVDSAYYGAAKSSKKIFLLGMAIMMGLCIPAGTILSLDLLKGRVNNKREIDRVISAPVISEISRKKKTRAHASSQENLLINEQFRALRTQLYSIHKGMTKGRVTLFTSSISGEGKSFIVSNLAISLAASERKTIVLELDLRRPGLASLLELRTDQPGISQLLRGKASHAQVIQQSPVSDNLYAVACGTLPDNPSELLENSRLETFIDYLKTEFDDILIDTPPAHLVSDAFIVDRLSDATLYLIRQGWTPKSELAFVEELNKAGALTNMNIIFNGIDRHKYGYGYKYDPAYYKGI